MRKFSIPFICSIILLSCSKEELNHTNISEDSIRPIQSTSSLIYNPIVGKWEGEIFKLLCPGVNDTTINILEKGCFVEFKKNDTAYQTYAFAPHVTGMSAYKIIDSSTLIYWDTTRIIHNDGVRLTTYSKLNDGRKMWMTYIKVNK